MRHTISLGFFVALAALTVGLRTPAEAGYYTPGTASVELRRIAALEVPDAGRTIDECMLYLYEAFDLQEIEIASVTTDDLQGHGSSERPALNADGSIVAFESDAPELTGEPGMGRRGQVMIRNRATRTTRLMSARGANASAPGDGESEEPSISADGERVAFSSNATDLLLPALVLKGEGDPGPSHAFLRSVPGSTTVQADVADDATPADGEGGFAVISADGDHVAFLSLAANLVAGDTNGGGDPFVGADVFVRHVALGMTERVSLSNDGSQAPGPHGLFSYDLPDALCDFQPPPCQEFFTGVAMSADGTQVAFSSVSSALVAGDGNQSGDPQSGSDVFVRDLTEGSTTRVSVASDGSEANGPSFGAAMSADGRYVAFASFATNLVPDDTNAGAVPSDQTDDTELARFAGLDVFVRDRVGGTTERVSVADDGAQANGPSGLFIERVPDADCRGDQTPPCYREREGFGISADGRFVVFVSAATELVAGDTNGEADVYVRDRVMGGTARVTVNAAREGANKGSSEPAISGDGTTIAFTSFATNLVAGDDNVDRRFSPPEADVFVAGNPLAE